MKDIPRLGWRDRFEVLIDTPSTTGCYGFVIVLGPLRLGATWPAREREL